MVPLTAIVADPHELVRLGVRRAFASSDSIQIIGEAYDGRSALVQCETHHPALLIAELALALPSGTQVIERTTTQQPTLRVVVYTARCDEGSVRAAFVAGAKGYVLKQSSISALVNCVDAVLRGDTYVDPKLPTVFRLATARFPRSELSPREQQVLALVAMGYSNKEIAERAAVSVKTVETYRSRAAEKLGLCSRSDFVRYALDQGLLNDSMLGS